MRFGAFVGDPIPWSPPSSSLPSSHAHALSQLPGSSLHGLALAWLTEDREYRRELEKQGRKARGARTDVVCDICIRCFKSIALICI